VDAVYADLKSKGVTFTVEPRNFKEVRVAFFKDSDGNTLELVEDPRRE
jgi:catechol 2,3-dioxygenase-like lactoylglutathione lyase family enzyme